MLKLYKRIDNVLHYHEAWAHDRTKIIEHWGVVGERGEAVEHVRAKGVSEKKAIDQVLAGAAAQGYQPIDEEEHAILLIEYALDDSSPMGTSADLKKRHALEERMNETLGWTGLGHCDGGSSGSGTMEVCCFVVDFAVAQRVIAADLEGTEFADYTRIYDENAEEPEVPKLAPQSGVLVPPWIKFPAISRADARWQAGDHAAYLEQWTTWFKEKPAKARAVYAGIFAEPKGWRGFYEDQQ